MLNLVLVSLLFKEKRCWQYVEFFTFSDFACCNNTDWNTLTSSKQTSQTADDFVSKFNNLWPCCRNDNMENSGNLPWNLRWIFIFLKILFQILFVWSFCWIIYWSIFSSTAAPVSNLASSFGGFSTRADSSHPNFDLSSDFPSLGNRVTPQSSLSANRNYGE